LFPACSVSSSKRRKFDPTEECVIATQHQKKKASNTKYKGRAKALTVVVLKEIPTTIPSSQQYTKTIYTFADMSKKQWVHCVPSQIPSKFVPSENSTCHKFISIDLYLYMYLNSGCFKIIKNDTHFSSVLNIDQAEPYLAMAKSFVLTSSALNKNILHTAATGSKNYPVLISDNIGVCDTIMFDIWTNVMHHHIVQCQVQNKIS